MAKIANTYETYDAAGLREDLSDYIWNISSTETPFVSAIEKIKAKATSHDWQTDSLRAPSTTVVVAGNDAAFTARTPTVRLLNQTSIKQLPIIVAGTLEAVDKAGRKSEVMYQLDKELDQLRRDLEAIMFDNNAAVASADTVAGETAGVPAFLTTNTSFGASGEDPDPIITDARTNGTQRAFTEEMLNTVHQSTWENGGNPDALYVGPFNKRVVSGFTGGANKTKSVDDKKIVASVEIYEGDFGTFSVIPNRFQRARDALLLEHDLWALAELRPAFWEKLAKTGDAIKLEVIWEGTLVGRQEAGNGGVFDLTTS